jgi:hypothetical protein
MRSDSSDAIDSQGGESHSDEQPAGADASVGIEQNWRDDTERTDVMHARHLLPALSPAAASDDPGWDDDAELTHALDFESLAPWYVPGEAERAREDDSGAAWELALTDRMESPLPEVHERPGRMHGERAPAKPVQAQKPRSREKRWSHELLVADGAADSRRSMSARRASTPSAHRSGSHALELAKSSRPKAAAKPSGTPAREPRSHARPLQPQTPPASNRSGQYPVQPTAAVSTAHRASTAALPPSAVTQPARPVQMRPPLPAAPEIPFTPPPRPLTPTLPVARVATPVGLDRDEARLLGKRRRSLSPAASILWVCAGASAAVLLAAGYRVWSAETSRAALTAVAPAPERAAAAPAETGFSITSEPAGASVFVDGKPTGLLTPARVRHLSAGLHAVDLKLPGYYETSLPAVLQDGSTVALPAVALRPLVMAEPPTISSPREMRVAERRARRAAARERRRAARREIIAAAKAYDTQEQTAEANEAAPTVVLGEGTLQINSRPWSRVLVDDEFVGNTPQRALKLRAGRHVIRLVNDSLNMEKKFTIEIGDGETITRIETLEDAPAQSGMSLQGDTAVARLSPRGNE